ncbi:uncharacterized protein [Elaeis guineensis]|uniref:uncharacterized protein n=1 Tax=Elaeis guineensis var. tenera TaxID=51953 RepID=UPI003C6CC5B8
MAFCKEFDARSQKYESNTTTAVIITAYKDMFEFIVKSPSVTRFLEKVAGLSSSITSCPFIWWQRWEDGQLVAGRNREVVARLKREQKQELLSIEKGICLHLP